MGAGGSTQTVDAVAVGAGDGERVGGSSANHASFLIGGLRGGAAVYDPSFSAGWGWTIFADVC